MRAPYQVGTEAVVTVALRSSAVLMAIVAGACSEDDLPIVARGRYVEIATDEDAPVCAGTAAFMDAYLEAVADTLGEALPDGVFVHYEWDATRSSGFTIQDGTRMVVTSERLPSEHELVHVVHGKLWPPSRAFLHEGLAVLLGDAASYESGEWPGGASLDQLLEAKRSELDYYEAWFIVSQIVRDHGFDGLREFWHAVPNDASAPEVRAAYEAMFGRSIDVLIEPDLIMVPGIDEPFEQPRRTCYFTACPHEPTPWDGDVWTAEAPNSCEDDDAIGPTTGGLAGDVWRSFVLDREVGDYRLTGAGGAHGIYRWCALRCTNLDTHAYGAIDSGRTYEELDPYGGEVRVDIGRDLEELPTDEPGGVEIMRLAP
jgi:hypothetical protein